MEALKGLSNDISLIMRIPGDWYVSHPDVEVKDGGVLCSRYGNGKTPEEAVNDHWVKLTQLKSHEYVVLGAYSMSKRRAYIWTGVLWAPYVKEKYENKSE